MDLQLTGRRALITGSSRGIGKAVALGLAREGADVALLARDAGRLDEAVREISLTTGRRVVGVRADTTDGPAVQQACADAARLLGGPLQILVNAAAEPAGYAAPPALADLRSEALQAEIDTKVMGYLRMAQAVVPGMQAAGWGRIVNVSGLAARQTGSTIGSIRNVAVAALTKNLADELGRSGIQVTCVHPGLTRTERTAGLVAHRARERNVSPEVIQAEMAATNGIGHLVTAEEVADVIVFLCSPRSRAIHGDAIAAGGGAPKAIHY